jgi:hypothetical protein
MRNGTSPCASLLLNNTFTSATNHERGFLKWNANVFQIGTEAGSGGGTVRPLEIRIGAQSGAAVFSAAGSGVSLNCRDVQVGASFNIGGDVILGRDAANVLAIQRTTNPQTLRIYNTVSGTNNVNFDRVNFRWASNEFIIDAEAGGTGTLRGIKIGSATSSLVGFFGATPVVQQAAVADATNGQSTQDRLNDLLARLRTLGLIAT